MAASGEVWIVGQKVGEDHRAWLWQGVFSTKAKAEAACRDETYFVGRATIDEELPHEETVWAEGDSWYPHDWKGVA